MEERVEKLKEVISEVENRLNELHSKGENHPPLEKELVSVKEEFGVYEYNQNIISEVFNSLDKLKYPKSVEGWNRQDIRRDILRSFNTRIAKIPTYAINHLRKEFEQEGAFFAWSMKKISKESVIRYCDDWENMTEYDN